MSLPRRNRDCADEGDSRRDFDTRCFFKISATDRYYSSGASRVVANEKVVVLIQPSIRNVIHLHIYIMISGIKNAKVICAVGSNRRMGVLQKFQRRNHLGGDILKWSLNTAAHGSTLDIVPMVTVEDFVK